MYVQRAQNKRIIFIDFLDTQEEKKKIEKCINKPKGVGEKEGGRKSQRWLGVSSPLDPEAVLCVCLVSVQPVSPVAVCG